MLSTLFRLAGGSTEEGDGVVSGTGLFLHDLCLVPGRLSGPLLLGAISYSHTLDRRTQLLQTGRVESHLILRPRLPFVDRINSGVFTDGENLLTTVDKR